MRHILVVLLTLIALIGLGLGCLALSAAPAFAVAAVPMFLIGTTALGAVTIASYIESYGERQLKEQRELVRVQLRVEVALRELLGQRDKPVTTMLVDNR